MAEIKKSQRIYFVIRYFHPFVGGLEKKAFHLARALTGAGFAVTIITSRFSRSWPKEEVLEGIKIIRLPSPRIKLAGAALYTTCLFLYLWRERKHFDVCHAFQVGYSSSAAILTVGILGGKTVLTLSSSGSGGDVARHRRTLWGRLFLQCCFKASCIVTLHEKMRDEITAHYPVKDIRIIPNGVDLAVHHPSQDRASLRRQLGLAPEDRMILYAGRFSAEKGVDFLLRAFHALRPGTAIRLWLFGDGPERSALHSLAAKLGLQATVAINPATDAISALLQAADLFIMPSQFEGMSNALLEAMASGVPVIATDVPGNRELISHEKTGLLVPFGDTSALAGAIETLLANPGLAGLVSENARKLVAAHYGSTDAVKRHCDVYAALASAGPGREMRA